METVFEFFIIIIGVFQCFILIFFLFSFFIFVFIIISIPMGKFSKAKQWFTSLNSCSIYSQTKKKNSNSNSNSETIAKIRGCTTLANCVYLNDMTHEGGKTSQKFFKIISNLMFLMKNHQLIFDYCCYYWRYR